MLRPRDRASLHTPQRSAAARQFGKAAQVAVVVGRTEKIRPARQLRGVLGWLDQGQRQQGYDAEMKKPLQGALLYHLGHG